MKSAETKIASSAHQSYQDAKSPFFKKGGEGTFFSQSSTDVLSPKTTEPFFSPTTIQPKLTIGQPNDKYEKEADATAERVVKQISKGESAPKDSTSSPTNNNIQTKCATCESEGELQRMEDEEISMKEMEIQRKPIFESAEDPPENNTVQRKCATCEKEEMVQKMSSDNNTPTPSADFQSQLNSSKGGGAPLSKDTRSSMESAFGSDFGNVRVHDNSSASEMSQSIGAQAFTHGSDIYFNEGKYDTGSTDGQKLLAHELTHTVQQGGALNRKIQKQEDKENPKPLAEIRKSKWGEIEQTATGKHMKLYNFKVKRNVNASKLGLEPPYEMPKGERKSKQRSVWKKGVKKSIIAQLKELVSDQDPKGQKYLLKVRGNETVAVTGTINQIVNEINVPYWDNGGNPTTFQVEHIIDYQIAAGNKEVDVISNLILLDAKENNKLGSVIRKEKIKHIERVLKHYKEANVVSTASEALHDYKITVETLKSSIRVRGTQYVHSDVKNAKANNNPFKKRIITLKKFEIPKGHFLLKTSQRGAGYVIPYNANGYKAGSFDIYADGNAEDHTLTSFILDPIVDEANVKKNRKEVSVFEGADIEVKGTDVFLIRGLKRRLRNLFELKPFSPVELNEEEMDFRGLNLRAFGKVLPTIPFLKDLDIGIAFNGKNIALEKTFVTSELTDKIPKPFKVDNSYLTLGVSTGIGIYANGGIDFGIPNIGEGTVTANANKEGFSLAGEFDFKSEKFDKSTLTIKYDSVKDKEGVFPWAIGGEIALGKNKIKGIESLSVKIAYENDILSGAGDVTLDIPGIQGGGVAAIYDNQTGIFAINANLQLADSIPGINGGKVEFGVAKKEGEADYSLSIGGEIEPNIPGITGTKLAVSYGDGILWIKAETSFSKGIVEGDISLGVTNQTVDVEGNPTGDVTKKLTPFGKGRLSVVFSDLLQGTIAARFTADGGDGKAKVLLDGEIGIPEEVDLSKGPFIDFDKEIIPFPEVRIPIFGVTALGKSVGIFAFIGGGIFFFAKVGPLLLSELKLGVKDFDPENPSSVEITGDAELNLPAEAGIRIHIEAGVGAAMIVEVKLSLTGDLFLKISQNIKGKTSLKWTHADGLELLEASVGAKGAVDIMGQIGGKLDIDLNLLFKTINLYRKTWNIGDPLYLGHFGEFDYEFPLSFKNNEVQKPGIEKFKYPKPEKLTDKDERMKMVEGSMKGSHKKLPPKPPGKKEIIRELKRRPAGFGFTNKFRLDKNTRYGYLVDLKIKYGPDADVPAEYKVDFSFVEPTLKPHENQELRKFRNEVFEITEVPKSIRWAVKDLRLFRLMKLGEFSESHWFVDKKLLASVKANIVSGNAPTEEPNQSLPEEAPISSEENMSFPEEEPLDLNQNMSMLPEEEPASEQNMSMAPEVQPKLEEETIQEKEETSNDFESQLNSEKGKGKALPDETQKEMGSAFGKDFSDVKIHDDASSSEMNNEIGAQAFTHGSDIYFNEGKYDTESKDGQELLAHELTHTVQQGGADVTPSIQKEDEVETPVPEVAHQRPSDAIDISHRFDPNAAWQAYLESERSTRNRNIDVPVKIGSDYHGNITIRLLSRRAAANRPGRYRLADNRVRHYLDINGMDFLNPLREAGVDPILVLNDFGDEGKTTGYLSVRKGNRTVGNIIGLIREINENLEAMNFLGLDPIRVPGGGIENVFEDGRLLFQINELTTTVDGFLEMGGGIGIVGNNLSFNLNANIDIEGLASGEFMIARDENGALSGRATIEADIANIHATIVAEYLAGVITLQGTGTIQSEKFNGSITLLVTDSARATQMMHAALGVDTLEDESESTEAPATPKTPANQVLVGWGEVTATITPWLEGSAKVGIDAAGHVTMVGELTVPDEIELMEQRGKKVDLFEVEIRAGYGIPLVGQVFLFASIGMFVNAGFGPLVLRDIRLEGVYSTDPAILQQFSISGSLAINAFAVLGLEAEAGVGVTLIGHDITAGVNVTAAAGIRAYALATPTFEYAESQAPEGGKVGEAHLRGHFEAAAQLFLQLTGALFYELDSPWWSPAPDGREESPLGEVQYPIGDSMGIGADLDWLVGSPDVPELEFSPVEFDPEQFTADVMADPPPNQRGNSEESPEGEWQDGTAEGDLENQPAVEEGGEGIPRGDRQEENLRNLPDEQKYMRGLSEISDIAESRERPTKAVVERKMNRIKNRYGLAQVQIRDESEEQVKIFVRHARQDNGNHLVEVPIMNEAERVRLLHDAMQDLDRRMDREANEEGKLSQQQAQSLSDAWHTTHPIIESIRVIDGGDSWDFQVDIGDENERVPGRGKLEINSEESIESEGENGEGELENPYPIIGLERPINVDGGHTLKLEGTMERILPNVYSRKKSLNSLLNEKREEIHLQQEQGNEVGDKSQAIDRLFRDKVTLGQQIGIYRAAVRTVYSGGRIGDIRSAFNEIVSVFEQIVLDLVVVGVNLNETNLPATQVEFSTENGKAKEMVAEPLTRVSGNTAGTSPTQNPVGWELISPEDRGRGRWVRVHLLSHQLHGPGTSNNLFPGTREMNLDNMENKMERAAKNLVWEDGKTLYYRVSLTYGNSGEFADIPTRIFMEYGEYNPESRQRRMMKRRGFAQEAPTQAYLVDVNRDSASRLNQVALANGKSGMGNFFGKLVQTRGGLKYTDIDDVEDRMQGTYSNETIFSRHIENLDELITNDNLALNP